MAGSIAALSLFRDCVKRSDSITLADDVINLSGESLSRKSATNLLSMRGRGKAYTLETIYYQWKCRDMAYVDYVKECEVANVERVNILDKRDLLAYLSGEVSEIAGLKSVTDVAVPSSDALEPAAKKHKTDAGLDDTTNMDGNMDVGGDTNGIKTTVKGKRQPREQRCIDAVLMAPDWDFSTVREKLGKSLLKAKNLKENRPSSGNDAQNGDKPAFDPRGDRYSNNQDRFWRENMGKDFHDFGINPTGSFAQMARKAKATATDSAAQKPKDKPAAAPPVNRRPASSSATKRKESSSRQDLAELRPILIIPGPGTAVMNVSNVKEFFEGGHFESEESLRNRGIAPDFSGRIRAHRTPGGNCSKAEYLLVSNVGRLSESEWDRVVGVICTGKPWQFKHWKYAKANGATGGNGIDVVNCLHHVQGFFFHYDDVAPDAKAASWAVKLIPISRTKRHNDTYAHTQFFDTVDNFIKTHSKRVRY